VATGAEDIILWDAATQTKFLRLEQPATVRSLTYSPDGRWLVSAHAEGSILVWDATEHSKRANLKEHSGPVHSVAFSPDGRLLAGAATDYGQLFLFATDKWQLVEKVGNAEPLERPRAVSFSPDGHWIVTGDIQGNVMLWGTKRLQKVGIIGRHAGETTSVAFSPDGRRVVSAGYDQTIALWDVQRRRLISYIGSHTAPVKSVAFSSDGRRLASGEGDGSVRIYTRHRTLWGHQLD
jgi:WD40 repeat protein